MLVEFTTEERLCWDINGQQLPLGLSDEVEVDTGLPLIPRHRGLIYVVGHGTPSQVKIIHSNKGTGVAVVDWGEFANSRQVRLIRRPASPEHANQIWLRAQGLIGYPYNATDANCEQFTDFCYNGRQGESPTVQAFIVTGLAICVAVAISDSP